jgi:tight adherence protein B
VTGLFVAALAAYGVFLLYTAAAFGWRGVGIGPPAPARRPAARERAQAWLAQAGLADVRIAEVGAITTALFLTTGAVAFAMFGGVLPSIVAAGFSATFPLASLRARRERRRTEARDAWPRMIEEMRLLTGSLGRSVPQALFDVGRRAPEEMRPAFRAAHREWMLTTDFSRTLVVLKQGLADPTADVVCETLLVAYDVGGTDLDRRLAALADDRVQDLQGRKTAKAKQAGVRFARRFVLLVPLGMALAGLSIGNGRQAYATTGGQVAVALGLGMIVVCWVWAGRLMRLPEEERVFG